MRLALLALAFASLSGCGVVYKQTIPQGNLLEQEQVNLLQPGMSKRQVALILGTPAVQSPFHQDRWDYIYSYQADGQPTQVKNLTLAFNDSQLVRIEGDFKPGGSAEIFKPEDVIKRAAEQFIERQDQQKAEEEASKETSK